MNTLLYDFKTCHVNNGGQTLSANMKPVFSFEYQALEFNGTTGVLHNNGENSELTPPQVKEIEDFILTVVVDPAEQINLDSRQYLAETDWYIIRKTETGLAIPTQILIARADARASITR